MFQNAKPIWLKNRSLEMNTLASFRALLKGEGEAELCITASSFYRVFVNGKFIAYGPARTAKGYMRVDCLPISLKGECELIIEAVGFYAESLTLVKHPSFCIAEVTLNGAPIAWTGRDFEAFAPAYHVQKVDRYSAQRHFTEVRDYRLGTSPIDPACRAEAEALTLDVEFLDRVVPYPTYEEFLTDSCTSYGVLEYDEAVAEKIKMKDRPKNEHWERWGHFEIDEMPTRPYLWAMTQKQIAKGGAKKLPLTVKAGEYAIFDLVQMETGFLQTSFEALEDCDVIVAFSEYYEQDGDFKIHILLQEDHTQERRFLYLCVRRPNRHLALQNECRVPEQTKRKVPHSDATYNKWVFLVSQHLTLLSAIRISFLLSIFQLYQFCQHRM